MRRAARDWAVHIAKAMLHHPGQLLLQAARHLRMRHKAEAVALKHAVHSLQAARLHPQSRRQPAQLQLPAAEKLQMTMAQVRHALRKDGRQEPDRTIASLCLYRLSQLVRKQ